MCLTLMHVMFSHWCTSYEQTGGKQNGTVQNEMEFQFQLNFFCLFIFLFFINGDCASAVQRDENGNFFCDAFCNKLTSLMNCISLFYNMYVIQYVYILCNQGHLCDLQIALCNLRIVRFEVNLQIVT